MLGASLKIMCTRFATTGANNSHLVMDDDSHDGIVLRGAVHYFGSTVDEGGRKEVQEKVQAKLLDSAAVMVKIYQNMQKALKERICSSRLSLSDSLDPINSPSMSTAHSVHSQVSALHKAAAAGELQTVQQQIAAAAAPLHATDRAGATPLMYARQLM